MKMITFFCPEKLVEKLDELVRATVYPSRAAAIRAGIQKIVKDRVKEET